ncbi:hypothetical protein LY12_004521 [Prauserella alba]|nr:hypothetical protein [Prauserella alba]
MTHAAVAVLRAAEPVLRLEGAVLRSPEPELRIPVAVLHLVCVRSCIRDHPA